MARKTKNKQNANVGKVNKRRQQVMEEEYDEYIYGNEPKNAITLDSLKRSRRYVIISIVFFVLSLALVAGFIFMKNATEQNHRNACWLHQQQIEELTTKYATDNGLASLPAYIEDVPGFEAAKQECPDGGEYTWHPVKVEYYCSVHGHWPPGFNKAQSVNQGSQTTLVEEK